MGVFIEYPRIEIDKRTPSQLEAISLTQISIGNTSNVAHSAQIFYSHNAATLSL